jgi:O-antigen/teichoic acid export membrane protein
MTRSGVHRLRESKTARAVTGSLGAALGTQLALMWSGIAVARMLGVDDRGHLALFALLVAILAMVGMFGLPVGVTYFLARGSSVRRMAAELRPLLIAQFAVLTPVQVAVLVVVFGHADASVRDAAWLSVLALPATLVQAYAFAIVQGQRRFLALNCLRWLPAGVYGFAVVIVWALGRGTLLEVTTAWVMSVVGVAAISLAVALVGSHEPERAPRVERREVVRFGLKGMLGSTSPLEAFRLDQAVIGLLLSPYFLGLYVVGVALTNLPRFIGQSLGFIAYPLIASRTTHSGKRATVLRFVVAGAFLTFVVVAALELLAGRLVPLFFGQEFAPAVDVTRLLLVAAFFASMRKLFADCAQGAGYPSFGSVAEIVSWAILVPSLIVLTPRYGVEGVAGSMVLAYAASCSGLALQLARAMATAKRPLITRTRADGYVDTDLPRGVTAGYPARVVSSPTEARSET